MYNVLWKVEKLEYNILKAYTDIFACPIFVPRISLLARVYQMSVCPLASNRKVSRWIKFDLNISFGKWNIWIIFLFSCRLNFSKLNIFFLFFFSIHFRVAKNSLHKMRFHSGHQMTCSFTSNSEMTSWNNIFCIGNLTEFLFSHWSNHFLKTIWNKNKTCFSFSANYLSGFPLFWVHSPSWWHTIFCIDIMWMNSWYDFFSLSRWK